MGWLEGKEERDRVLADIIDILEEGIVKCLCGNILTPNMLKSTKIGNEYWIYAHCKKCKYNFNYEKILNQYHAIKEVTLN